MTTANTCFRPWHSAAVAWFGDRSAARPPATTSVLAAELARPSAAHSRVKAWRVALWHEMPEVPAVAGHDLVERVDDRRRVDCPERPSHRPRQTDFGQEHDAASGVTGDRGPVADNEPPAFEPGVFGHACEQTTGLLIRKGKNRDFFVSVESDDDTRRPSAELSGAVIEHHGATELHPAATDGELDLQGPRISASRCERSRSRQ